MGEKGKRRSGASAALERGRRCFDERKWKGAFAALREADESAPLAIDDLERLAWSAGLTGRDPDLLAALERLHQAALDAGKAEGAARAAFWLGFRLLGIGEPGRGGGWLARAERLTEDEGGDSVVRGYLLLPGILRHLATGSFADAVALAARAVAVAERFADRDLAAFARSLEGRALLHLGRVDEGLSRLDESMLAATAGELSPIVTGLVYCGVIATCERVHAIGRAREWTAALAGWCAAQPELVTFTDRCRVHRAEVLCLGGAWDEAIAEARRACDRTSRPADPDAIGEAHYQRAEIHRLRGELDAAEEAYAEANRHGREPQPGLALLRLAQGHPDAAATSIRRLLESTGDRLSRTRFLPAAVEILVAVGDVDGARDAAAELAEIAGAFEIDVLDAMAAHALGAVRLAAGDAGSAVESLRAAFRAWRDVGAPYIAARIRVLLGRAYRALGDGDGARLELDAAARVFVDLGAAPDAAVVSGTFERARTASHGLTPREVEVLRLVAAGKTNKAIARELFVAEKTVDRHVSNIFAKTNVASRAAATAFAFRNGLV